jgi:CheY-like chemotaxis protein
MKKKILILEDNAERRAAMERCLHDRFYQFDTVFFDSAAEMVEYCDANLNQAILIGLDHDLELRPGPDGRCQDMGTGRDVANYLAEKKPTCPIVIHTSNGAAAIGMEGVLQDAHWTTHRVLPMDDLEWIPTQWFRTIRRAMVGPVGKPAPST